MSMAAQNPTHTRSYRASRCVLGVIPVRFPRVSNRVECRTPRTSRPARSNSRRAAIRDQAG